MARVPNPTVLAAGLKPVSAKAGIQQQWDIAWIPIIIGMS
jgi:hypothetical protein